MTNQHDDGGQAFPIAGSSSPKGMPLLDYFAGQALWRVEHQWSEQGKAAVAKECYSMADAMIAEKRRREAQDET